jgi:hypothetical protein
MAEPLQEGRVMAGAALLLFLVLAGAGAKKWSSTQEEAALSAAFLSLCRDLKFRPPDAALEDPEVWCAGEAVSGVPVLVHWYTGTPGTPAVKGIAVTMPVGVLEGGGWGVELGSGETRFWGEGPGEEALRAALPERLLERGRKLPVGVLLPLDRVPPQSELGRALKSLGSTQGLGIRALLGRNSEAPQVRLVLAQMAALRAGIRGEQVEEGAMAPPPPPQAPPGG